MSAIIVAMTSSALESLLTDPQVRCVGSHAEWTYRIGKPNGCKINKVRHSPAQYLPSPIMFIPESQVFNRCQRKELTMQVESDAGPPHNNRQRHNSLVSVPDRNANGINQHLIPEMSLNEAMAEHVRAKNNQ